MKRVAKRQAKLDCSRLATRRNQGCLSSPAVAIVQKRIRTDAALRSAS